MEETSSMTQCDLCGKNVALTAYTIYSAKSAGPGITTSQTVAQLPNQVIVTTTKPYKEFVTHRYLICKRCAAFTKVMTVFGIVLLVSIISLAVIAVLNKEYVRKSPFQILTVFAIYLFIIFCSAIAGHFVDPAKRLKRKAKRSRGKAFEFGAWTEKEFEQAFGKQKPD
jgi:hypothetical protein